MKTRIQPLHCFTIQVIQNQFAIILFRTNMYTFITYITKRTMSNGEIAKRLELNSNVNMDFSQNKNKSNQHVASDPLKGRVSIRKHVRDEVENNGAF